MSLVLPDSRDKSYLLNVFDTPGEIIVYGIKVYSTLCSLELVYWKVFCCSGTDCTKPAKMENKSNDSLNY